MVKTPKIKFSYLIIMIFKGCLIIITRQHIIQNNLKVLTSKKLTYQPCQRIFRIHVYKIFIQCLSMIKILIFYFKYCIKFYQFLILRILYIIPLQIFV